MRFKGQNSLDFQGPSLLLALVNELPPSRGGGGEGAVRSVFSIYRLPPPPLDGGKFIAGALEGVGPENRDNIHVEINSDT
jgi:hypothetical protein